MALASLHKYVFFI